MKKNSDKKLSKNKKIFTKLCYEFGMLIFGIEKLMIEANDGDKLSQYQLGICYKEGSAKFSSGKKIKSDWKEALKWFRLSAEQGNKDAQWQLGSLYSMGLRGITKNIKDAIKWFQLSAEQGHVLAQYNLARIYYDSEDIYQDKKQAIKYFESAAENNFLESQLQLGFIYLNGDTNIKQDYNIAMNWYKKAAEKGSEEAQYTLGVMYENGQGVDVNIEEAIMWFKLSAEQNAEDAQFALGKIYFKQNEYINAYKWLKIADINEHETAKAVLDLLTVSMSKEQINKAENLANILIKNELGLLE
jgi:hypothetical protein